MADSCKSPGYRHANAEDTGKRGLTSLHVSKRSGRLDERRAFPPAAMIDPYTLVLLAEQERQACRDKQAECLIEAAFEAYDKCETSARRL